MLIHSCLRVAAAAAWLTSAGVTVSASAQEMTPHLAVYEIVTGRASAGASPPEVRGTYAFRLQGECGGGLKFEQRLRFEARSPSGSAEIDQTSTGSESADGKRYRFSHKSSLDGKSEPEVRGEVIPGDEGHGQARFSQPTGRVVPIPAGTLFPISIMRRTVKAARDGETGFEARFFIGDKPEAPQSVSVLLGKPPRRVADLPLPQGDRSLVEGRDRFYFHAAFYDEEATSTGEPRHELSSVTLDNGIEIWGTHEQGELRLEYRLIRIEALPKPEC
ncbi:EipB family protein [Reyranella sp. CPCC 100927]|uniref:EipB family protein n=1 Tax=Reyranella sp. CPCC 100927 TaxID=2599616 RepID=UPI0011B377F4|nr:DUF1849 family protein [Reyranella sp. CPCC 100927]TWT03818.1 DUF1849 family protein [Reyranella sp. CPCC 100927]